MVRDGYYYAVALIAVAALLAWLAGPGWAVLPLLLAAFFLWFFRDPERLIPDEAGAIVSPADGKVTSVSTVEVNGEPRSRISIFLSVFDVHVNRCPIEGVIQDVYYQRGQFRNAMGTASAESNEQNIVTVTGAGHTVIFKQIAGLLARRIVFTRKVGDRVRRGERIGMIKFGSRVDVIFDAASRLQVKIGDRVRGGATVLATLPDPGERLAVAAGDRERSGGLP
jgi:phosphatidylserine decarboxylase